MQGSAGGNTCVRKISMISYSTVLRTQSNGGTEAVVPVLAPSHGCAIWDKLPKVFKSDSLSVK